MRLFGFLNVGALVFAIPVAHSLGAREALGPDVVNLIYTCAICGDLVRSEIGENWNLGERARRAMRDMQAHLNTHSFAELLRFEIRQDLDQVPEEQRPAIVRDIYRSLLGTTHCGVFTLDAHDGHGVYSIDEALGDMALYQLWRAANACGLANCAHSVD